MKSKKLICYDAEDLGILPHPLITEQLVYDTLVGITEDNQSIYNIDSIIRNYENEYIKGNINSPSTEGIMEYIETSISTLRNINISNTNCTPKAPIFCYDENIITDVGTFLSYSTVEIKI